MVVFGCALAKLASAVRALRLFVAMANLGEP
jgi:hypothetical protein